MIVREFSLYTDYNTMQLSIENLFIFYLFFLDIHKTTLCYKAIFKILFIN